MRRNSKDLTTDSITSSESGTRKIKTRKVPSLTGFEILDQQDFKQAQLPDNWKSVLLCCGSNASGQLSLEGVDLMSPSFIIAKTSDIPPPVSISCGGAYSTSICDDGSLYMWGSGPSGVHYRIPTQINTKLVKFVSCGQNHAGLITNNGQVYTWGKGEHGALGHGNKHNVSSPKHVAAFANNIQCIAISCGSYHTGFIAGPPTGGGLVSLPIPTTNSIKLDELPFIPEDDSDTEKFENSQGSESSAPRYPSNQDTSHLVCGTLYMCGLGKVGQLGLGDVKSLILSPRPLTSLSTSGYRAAKVSCGMHHTLVLAVPITARDASYKTTVMAFGWGEHGRLGVGDEDKRLNPTPVPFPVEDFNAIDVSAGEQHSLAMGLTSCYGWGSNEFGQLGSGGSRSGTLSTASATGISGSAGNGAEMSVLPVKVALPENIRVVRLRAGGRHSCAITSCGKVLAWGWGEEGQLGHGDEKNCSLPRPSRLPSAACGKSVVLEDIAVGTTHTVALLRNLAYVPRPPTPPAALPVAIIPPKVEVAATLTIVELSPETEPPPSPHVPMVEAEIKDVPLKQSQRHHGVMTTDDDDDDGEGEGELSELSAQGVAIRGLRDILSKKDLLKDEDSVEDHSAESPTPPQPVIIKRVLETDTFLTDDNIIEVEETLMPMESSNLYSNGDMAHNMDENFEEFDKLSNHAIAAHRLALQDFLNEEYVEEPIETEVDDVTSPSFAIAKVRPEQAADGNAKLAPLAPVTGEEVKSGKKGLTSSRNTGLRSSQSTTVIKDGSAKSNAAATAAVVSSSSRRKSQAESTTRDASTWKVGKPATGPKGKKDKT